MSTNSFTLTARNASPAIIVEGSGGSAVRFDVDAEAGSGHIAHPVRSTSVSRPSASPHYSVAYSGQLVEGRDFPGRSPATHFQESNRQLHEALSADPEYAASLEAQYPGIIAGVQPGARGAYPRRAPTSELTWHHNAWDDGRMELVPTAHHEAAGPVQRTLHPNRRGGMEVWGGGRKRKKPDE